MLPSHDMGELVRAAANVWNRIRWTLIILLVSAFALALIQQHC